jgi:putative hydrolase of the HAD superfamily
VTVTHLFFDIGGVLGSNAWDREQRAAAVAAFHLDAAELAERHPEAAASLETGRMTLGEYLRTAVFHRPRAFTPEDFTAYVKGLSTPWPASIAFARALGATGRWRLATLNNESAELNVHRLKAFGLTGIFGAFFSSCWLGVAKPSPRIFELALAMSQAEPAASVLVDDRTRNCDAARAIGMLTVQFTDVERLRGDLAALGVVI